MTWSWLSIRPGRWEGCGKAGVRAVLEEGCWCFLGMMMCDGCANVWQPLPRGRRRAEGGGARLKVTRVGTGLSPRTTTPARFPSSTPRVLSSRRFTIRCQSAREVTIE
eukprot:scaffold14269_cov276-Alexandrium_tamarense.AAC.1